MVSVTLAFYCCDLLAFTFCLARAVSERRENEIYAWRWSRSDRKRTKRRRNRTRETTRQDGCDKDADGWGAGSSRRDEEWFLRGVGRRDSSGRASKRPLDSIGYTRLNTDRDEAS
jgi:hypothetical protein